jgi:hypothetical protein
VRLRLESSQMQLFGVKPLAARMSRSSGFDPFENYGDTIFCISFT